MTARIRDQFAYTDRLKAAAQAYAYTCADAFSAAFSEAVATSTQFAGVESNLTAKNDAVEARLNGLTTHYWLWQASFPRPSGGLIKDPQ